MVPEPHPRRLLRIDAAKITADAELDGKYLLRTSDPHLTTEDIALGYQQLLEVERGWRDMKQVLDLRPLYHRIEDRIRAHVAHCWLALLLARIVETRAATPDQAPRPDRTAAPARRDLHRPGPCVIASAWAGHADLGFTKRVYIHLKAAATQLDQLLG